MNEPRPFRGPTAEDGFVLAAVLVFMLVLTLSAFSAATLTRTDVQLVNNELNEKRAFYIAEAGIAEALVRLGLTSTTSVAVDGASFDASLTGTNAPVAAQPCWKAQILYGGSGPVKTDNTVTTPTLQPQATRLAYSNSAADSETLTIGWDRGTGTDPTTACTGTETISRIGGRQILEIVSTGQSGLARRRVLRRVALNNIASVVLRADVCPGVRTQGSGTVAFPGAIQINSSSCATGVSAGGSSAITAIGPISVSSSGYAGNVSPTPTINAPQVPDPLAAIPAPSLSGQPVRGTGTAALPVRFQASGTQTIQPGVYYGGISMASGTNVTMAPGVYIMAGGGFHVTSNGSVTTAAGGVLIYNTCASTACSSSSFTSNDVIELSSTRAIQLVGRDSSDSVYGGIVIFQDRANSRPLSVTAGATGDIDGLIYAKEATLSMGGNADLLHSQLVVGAIDLQGGPQLGAPTTWLPLGAGAGVRTVSWQDF